jgi:peptidoglycan/LPS O-acetylase OafA/YrhL
LHTVLTSGWFFANGLFWFAFGIFAGSHREKFQGLMQSGRRIWLFILLGLIFLGIVEWEGLYSLSGREWLPPTFTALDGLYCIIFLIAFLSFDDRWLILKTWIVKLGGKSYGIYLVHTLALILIARSIYHLAPAVLQFALFFVMFLTVGGILIPVSMMEFVKRTPIRRGYEILFG